MRIVKISSKGQITLPSTILTSLNLHPKAKVLVEKGEGVVIVKPLPSSVAQELAGCLTTYVHPSKLGVPFAVVMEETKKKVAKHLATKK